MKIKSIYFNTEKTLILLLIISPVLFYLYLIFPNEGSMEFFGFKLIDHHYESLEYMFWIIFIKTNLILLLSLWFFYNKQWWRYAILPILSYTIYQLASTINEGFDLSPIFERYYAIFFFIIVVPLYLILDKIIGYKTLDLNAKVEKLTEFTLKKLIAFDDQKFNDLKSKLEMLKLQKNNLSEKQYLVSLMTIQTAMEKMLK